MASRGDRRLGPVTGVRVEKLSRAELEARRAEILRKVGASLEELAARAEASSLVGAEWDAWEELEDIAFLLGDHAA